MNILFLISSLSNEAPVKILLDIAKHVKTSEQKVYVLIFYKEKNNSLKAQFIDAGLDVHCLNVSKLYCEIFTGKVRHEIEKFIYEKSIDFIHCSSYNTTVVCSKIRGITKSLTFHNYCSEDFVFSKGLILGTYMSVRFLKSVRRYELPVAISKTMGDFYQKKLKSSVQVVYNGIDVEKYHNVSPSEKIDKRNELNLPATERIFLVSGSLIKRKNPLFIIDAFVKAKIPDAILVFIGNGYMTEKCKKRAEKHSEVIFFRGFVNNPVDYLKASDFLISASFSEGLPLNVIEAVSVGLPLLLSNIAPHKEIKPLFPDNSVCLFNNRSVNELVNGMIEMNKNSLNNGNILHQMAMENFSKEKMCKNYYNLFKTNL